MKTQNEKGLGLLYDNSGCRMKITKNSPIKKMLNIINPLRPGSDIVLQ